MRKLTDPIQDDSQDLFQRSRFVEHLLRTLVNESGEVLSTGNIVSLEGQWGTGKSSILNLLLSKLNSIKDLRVIHFVPWMAGPNSNIVEYFFSIILSDIKKDFDTREDIIEDLKIYAEISAAGLDILSSLSGQPWNIVNRLLKARFKKNPNPVEIHSRINNRVNFHNLNFVIVIDELDRLSNHEIREVIRLIRAVADFDQFSYIVAFDKSVVNSALESDVHTSGEYLKKIFNLEITIPLPLQSEFSALIDSAIEEGIGESNKFNINLDDDRYIKLKELISTSQAPIRDTTRAISALFVYLEAVDLEAHWVDILAIIFLKHNNHELFSIIVREYDFFVLNPVNPQSIAAMYTSEEKRREQSKEKISWDNLDKLSKSLFEFLFPSIMGNIQPSPRRDSLQFRSPLLTVLRFGQLIQTISLRELKRAAQPDNEDELQQLWMSLFQNQDGDGIEQAFDFLKREIEHIRIWRSIFSSIQLLLENQEDSYVKLAGLIDLVSNWLFKCSDLEPEDLLALLRDHRAATWQLVVEVLRRNVFYVGAGRWNEHSTPERAVLDTENTEYLVRLQLETLLNDIGIQTCLKRAVDSNFIWLFHDLETEYVDRFTGEMHDLLGAPRSFENLLILLFGPGYSTSPGAVTFFAQPEEIVRLVRERDLTNSENQLVRQSARRLLQQWERE